MKRLLLRTYGSGPDGDTQGVDCAVLTVTPDVIQVLQDRVDIAYEAWKKDQDLYELYFWDTLSVTWHNYRARGRVLTALDEAGDNQDDAWDDNGKADVPKGVMFPDEEYERWECGQTIVRCQWQSGRDTQRVWEPVKIVFFCYPKHGWVQVTTEAVTLEELSE